MDPGTLVESQLSDGQKLIDLLVENGIPISGACWMRETDGGLWYLYVVTPLVSDRLGTTPAYARINSVIRARPASVGIDPFRIKAVRPSARVAQAIRDVQNRILAKSPVWYSEPVLGGVSIDGAYIYPPPMAAVTP